MVMLGALAALSGLVDLETLKQTLSESGRAANERALERGFALGKGEIVDAKEIRGSG